MKICIITDAWHDQINGVVTTYDNTIRVLESHGYEILVIHPGLVRCISYPLYPEFKIPLTTSGLSKRIDKFAPDFVHIATESRLGLWGRWYCKKRKLYFTTAYHTKFPEYAYEHFGIPTWITRFYLKWFHGISSCIMVNTPTLFEELADQGFKNLKMWGRGVDTSLFAPGSPSLDLEHPVWVNVGRVSYEKNIKAFLDLDLPGTKVIVGDGPHRQALQKAYPKAVFLGSKSGKELVQAFNEGDVFVFPSKTDTFGVVLIEALACGKPLAGFDVTGPRDIVESGVNGWIGDDLREACLKALEISPKSVLESAKKYTWEFATAQFLENLHVIDDRRSKNLFKALLNLLRRKRQ